MKKIRLFIIPVLALFITFVGVSSLFATAKPSSAVYGVYSDAYSGAIIDGSGDNAIKLFWWYNIRTDVVESSAGDIAPDGNKYTRYTFTSAAGALSYTRDNSGVIDMSNYSGGKIKFSARSRYASRLKTARVGFQIKTGEYVVEDGTKDTYDNYYDGALSELTDEWKEFEVDIPDNDALKAIVKEKTNGIEKGLEDVSSLFVFLDGNGPYQDGDTIDIDNIRWERADGAFEEIDVTGINFSAELQNGSDNKITWYADGTDISTVENVDWKIANEHINLKITKFLDKDNNEYPIGNGKTVSSYPFSSSSLSKWKFRIYTLGGTKNGLLPYESGNYYDGAEPLPICWRLTDSELSNSETITETVDDNGDRHLENSDGWKCWLYIQNIASEDYNTEDYAIMWNNSRGYRGSEGDYYGGPSGFDVTPKLYIGAKFKNAVGGLEYKSTIVIECYDE